jgi:hypothetical protein
MLNHYLIWIKETPWTSVFLEQCIVLAVESYNTLYTVKIITDIPEIPPCVT